VIEILQTDLNNKASKITRFYKGFGGLNLGADCQYYAFVAIFVLGISKNNLKPRYVKRDQGSVIRPRAQVNGSSKD
jgi:hypothetical protein